MVTQDLTFFPGLVITLLLEYLLIIILFLWQCGRCCNPNEKNKNKNKNKLNNKNSNNNNNFNSNFDNDNQNNSQNGNINDIIDNNSNKIEDKNENENENILSNSDFIENKITFQNTYESYSPFFQYLLLFTRILSLLYIMGISVIFNDLTMDDNKSWFYFTNWNTKLIALFFLFAVILSILGLFHIPKEIKNDSFLSLSSISTNDDENDNDENIILLRFSKIFHVLFEVCGGSAVLVTVIAFCILDPTLNFWNISTHLITLISIIIELILNNMIVKFNHLPYNLSWAMIYLVFVWVIIFFKLEYWPYFFLKTDTINCYIYYDSLLLADLFFYTIFYGLSRIKILITKTFRKNDNEFQKFQHNKNRRNVMNNRRYKPIIKEDNINYDVDIREEIMF